MKWYVTWKVDCHKLETCIINLKTKIKITKQRVLANDHTKKEWNHKKTQSKKKAERVNKGTQNRWDKQKINSKMVDLN